MRKSLSVLSGTMVALLLLACKSPISMSGSPTGSLTLSIPANAARSILPASIDILSYSASGIGPSGATIPVTTSSTGSFFFTALSVGSWTITVNGMDASNAIIASGTTTVSISATQSASASIQLVPKIGTGNLSLSVSWPSARQVDSVTGILTSSSGTSTTLILPVTADAATYSGNFASGSYVLFLNFRLANKIVAAPISESVLIYATKTSSAALLVSDAQFNLATSAPTCFTDGFESSDFSANGWGAAGTVDPTVTGDVPHLGTESVKFDTTNMYSGSTSTLSIAVNPSVASEISFWQKPTSEPM